MSEQSEKSPTEEDMAQDEGGRQLLGGQNLQEEDDEKKVTTPLPSSAGEASMARNSPRSPPATSQDMALEEEGGQQVEAQGEDDKEKMATPLTASAGEASMARNSSTSPPATSPLSGSGARFSRSVKIKISYLNCKRRMEDRCNGSSTEGLKTPRYSEVNRHDVAESSHSGSQTAGEMLSVSEDESPACPPFIQRVFTDTDTKIGFLKGIIDYYKRNGIYPCYDSVALDDFIVNWLQVNVTGEQLIDALVKLRRKYFRAMLRMGTMVSFVDPLNQIVFDLSNKLWGTAIKDWKHLKRKEPEK